MYPVDRFQQPRLKSIRGIEAACRLLHEPVILRNRIRSSFRFVVYHYRHVYLEFLVRYIVFGKETIVVDLSEYRVAASRDQVPRLPVILDVTISARQLS